MIHRPILPGHLLPANMATPIIALGNIQGINRDHFRSILETSTPQGHMHSHLVWMCHGIRLFIATHFHSMRIHPLLCLHRMALRIVSILRTRAGFAVGSEWCRRDIVPWIKLSRRLYEQTLRTPLTPKHILTLFFCLLLNIRAKTHLRTVAFAVWREPMTFNQEGLMTISARMQHHRHSPTSVVGSEKSGVRQPIGGWLSGRRPSRTSRAYHRTNFSVKSMINQPLNTIATDCCPSHARVMQAKQLEIFP